MPAIALWDHSNYDHNACVYILVVDYERERERERVCSVFTMIKNQNSKVVQREDIMGGRCKKGLKEEIILKSTEFQWNSPLRENSITHKDQNELNSRL